MNPSSRTESAPARLLPDGLRIRPVAPEDREGIEQLLEGLSLEARERRFFTGAVDLGRAAAWATHPERVDAVGLVVAGPDGIAGHGVLVPMDATTAEVAFEVAASWRHQGVAGALLRALEQEARARGVTRLVAEVLARNADMLAVFRERGPLTQRADGSAIHVVMPLTTE
ncbi:MAG: CoA-binding domain protein [Solirubrobacterales bacterium]|nr:CoA-binding domain protein [Solirubrobacterales bacterium]